MHKFGMSFITGFGANPDNYYTTSADNMGGNPPLSFGSVFAVQEHGSATEQAVWGNLNTTATPDEGWLLKVDGQWQLLPSQIVEGVMGALTLDAGIPTGGSQTHVVGSEMRVVFAVVCADGTGPGSNAYLYLNGNLITTTSGGVGPLQGTDSIYLGYTPSDLALNPLAGHINMAFYDNSCLSAIQVRALWEQLQHYGRLDENTDLDYIWQVHHNPAASATWTSHGSATTAKVLTRTGTLSVGYWPRVSWANIVPADTASSIFDVTAIQNSAYTASCSEAVLVDPSGGGFTITLPAAPTAGCIVRISNVTSSVNTMTFDGGANDVEDPDLSIDAMGTTATIAADGFSLDYMYTGTFWKIV